MRTDRPSLTPRLIAIRQAVARGDYSCLGAGGEVLVFAYAKRCGIGADELLHEWAGHDAPVRKAAARPAAIPKLGMTSRIETDLDYWPDTEAAVAEADDDMPVCPTCKGTGKAEDGSQCEECSGSGRLPLDDDDDGEDEKDDDDEKE